MWSLGLQPEFQSGLACAASAHAQLTETGEVEIIRHRFYKWALLSDV